MYGATQGESLWAGQEATCAKKKESRTFIKGLCSKTNTHREVLFVCVFRMLHAYISRVAHLSKSVTKK